MSERPTHFRIRNLERYQHYKERRPTWLKFYQATLEDAELMRLPDASKWLAVGLLLVASRYDNVVPYDPAWVGRTLHMDAPADLDALLSIGYIESCAASNVLASGKRVATPKRREKREERTEKTTSRKRVGSAPTAPRLTWLTPLQMAHEAVMGTGSFAPVAGQYAKAFRQLVDAHGPETCASAITRALRSPEARFLTPVKIAARFADFATDPDERIVTFLSDAPTDTLAKLGIVA